MGADVENKKHSSKGILRSLRKFARDCHGLAAIEFAFVFPVMAALYLGGTALTQGIVIKRKVTLATRAVGDLASQDSDITNDEMTAIFAAGAAILQPYPIATMTLTITSLKVDKDGIAKVAWSDKSVAGVSTTGRIVGSVYSLPTGINVPNVDVIMAEGSYTYTPPVGNAYISGLPLNETFYLRPRRVTCITRNAVPCT
jgi:Flp pilus assembly protein TadG